MRLLLEVSAASLKWQVLFNLRRSVPWKTIAAVAGALLYVLNPLDFIPDLILGFGFLDDAGVVALCLKLVESDLHRYAAWKEHQVETNPLAGTD